MIQWTFKWIGLALVSTAAFAKGPDFTVFEVRRQLALSNSEKTEKDFYIYAGSEEGVKAGMVYDVVRRVPLYDGYQNRSLGEVTIKVAKIKVIFVDKNVSIARFHSDISREDIPILQDNYILLGDIVDVGSAEKVAGNEKKEHKIEKKPENEVKVVINSVDVTEKAFNP